MDRNQIPKRLLSGQLRDEQRRAIIVTQKDDPTRETWVDHLKLIAFIAFVILAAAWLEGGA